MFEPIRFLLNDREISSTLSPGTVMLDFLRKHQRLVGTKIGCREGDCGACTVLVGEPEDGGGMRYQSMTSCIMPLANAHGKHIVTIEGLNVRDLTPYQQAMVDEAGTQCGFCTVGFVVSFAGYCLAQGKATQEDAIAAIDGNICRCTGYKSIERAAEKVVALLQERPAQAGEALAWLAEHQFLPAYFPSVPQRLAALRDDLAPLTQPEDTVVVGGGTDLFVQKPEHMAQQRRLTLVFDRSPGEQIYRDGDKVVIRSSATAEDMRASALMNQLFPAMRRYMKLVSSTPIRNMGTVAGNLVNASPIGDLTCFLMANQTEVVLKGENGVRVVALRAFYKGYKTLDRQPGEVVHELRFNAPRGKVLFNFEKVSKRTHLDIASVNSALRLQMDGDRITRADCSAGGVGPTPMYLDAVTAVLEGQTLSSDLITRAAEAAAGQAQPISDARGEHFYKRLLLRQLIYGHFATLTPELVDLEAVR